jgi:hypothetical protein
MYPNNSVDLYGSYLHATAKPLECLALDLSQDIDDRLRIRTKMFPEKGLPLPLIYVRVFYETHTVNLSRPALS